MPLRFKNATSASLTTSLTGQSSSAAI